MFLGKLCIFVLNTVTRAPTASNYTTSVTFNISLSETDFWFNPNKRFTVVLFSKYISSDAPFVSANVTWICDDFPEGYQAFSSSLDYVDLYKSIVQKKYKILFLQIKNRYV